MAHIDRYEELLKNTEVGYVRIGNLLLREYNQIIIPLGQVVQPKPDKPIDYKSIFKTLKGKLIWWSWFSKNSNNEDWYAVIKKSHIEIDEYPSSNIRNQIRKGLKSNVIKKIPVEVVLNEGFGIYKKAIEGYSKATLSEGGFKKQISATIGFDDIINYWGIFNNDILIGYAVVYCYGKHEANISEIRIDRAYNKQYPSYALFHALSNEYLKLQGFGCLSDGYKNLLHATNIQSMLIKKFGFEKVVLNLELAIRFPFNLFVFVLYPFKPLIKNSSLNAVFNLLGIYNAQKRLPKQ